MLHPVTLLWPLNTQHEPFALYIRSQKATPKNPVWNPSSSDLRHVYYESQCLLASHRAFCSYKNMGFNYRKKLLIFSYQHISTHIKSLFLNCIGLECLIFKIVIWKLRRELSWKNWLEDLGSAPTIHIKNQSWWCVLWSSAREAGAGRFLLFSLQST